MILVQVDSDIGQPNRLRVHFVALGPRNLVQDQLLDPELNKWFNNLDFRKALSFAIDREQINETFFLGIGTPGSGAPAETNKYSPGPEWRQKWSTLDVNQSNELLDKATAVTPGLEGPTVSPLQTPGWSAVRAMVRQTETNRVMDELWELGARAILVTSIHASRI